MPIGSQRVLRDRFTRVLKEIASELSLRETYTVRCRMPVAGIDYQSSFSVVALWAFGSWARGAATCGDLDLIVEIRLAEGTKRWPLESAVIRTVRRRRKYLDVHVGTPEKLGDIAADAVLVWSIDHPDFSAQIDAIPVLAGASRHPRRHDAIPVDVRRLLMPFDERDGLTDAVQRGTATICWRDVHEVPQLAPEDAAWIEQFALGRAARRVLPIALDEAARWMPREEMKEAWRRGEGRADFRTGGIRLSFERWKHSHVGLDSLGCCAILVVPHWTRRGPNGVMVVKRGPEHPLVRRFQGVGAWVVERGLVEVQWNQDLLGWRSIAKATCLELFTTREKAAEMARSFEDERPMELNLLTAQDLLHSVDCVDLVNVDSSEYVAITPQGARFLRDEGLVPEVTSAPEERLLALLKAQGGGP